MFKKLTVALVAVSALAAIAPTTASAFARFGMPTRTPISVPGPKPRIDTSPAIRHQIRREIFRPDFHRGPKLHFDKIIKVKPRIRPSDGVKKQIRRKVFRYDFHRGS